MKFFSKTVSELTLPWSTARLLACDLNARWSVLEVKMRFALRELSFSFVGSSVYMAALQEKERGLLDCAGVSFVGSLLQGFALA